MKQSVKKTNFSMSYADLSGISKQKVNTVIRDIAEFERFGITAEQVNAFRAKVEDFDNTQIDQEFRGVIVAATVQKNELANQVRHLIRETSVFIKQHYGLQSSAYQTLEIKELSQLSDTKLFRRANSVIRVARLVAGELPTGIETAVNELETVNNSFSNSIENKNSLVEQRDIATHGRISLANSIYKELMEYCEIGQVVWAETHEAKYNDYVIYGSSSASSPPENSDNGDEGDEELPNG